MTSPEIKSPLHLLHCTKELIGMKAMELYRQFGEFMDDALDIWPEGEDE